VLVGDTVKEETHLGVPASGGVSEDDQGAGEELVFKVLQHDLLVETKYEEPLPVGAFLAYCPTTVVGALREERGALLGVDSRGERLVTRSLDQRVMNGSAVTQS
jgi:hypothetical protein